METKASGWLFCMVLFVASLFSTRAQDSLPVVNLFAIGPYAVNEGGTVQLFLTKDRPVEVRAQLDFSGTAIRGLDYGTDSIYVPVTNTFVLAATNSGRSINLWVGADSRVEGDETIVVTLLADPSYVLGPYSNATITITDKTIPPTGNSAPSNRIPPTPLELLTAGSDFSITSIAYDSDDEWRVDYYDRTNFLGSVLRPDKDTTNRFTFKWTNVPVGSHEIFSRAVDARGKMKESAHFTNYAAFSVAPIATASIAPGVFLTNTLQTWSDPVRRASGAIMQFLVPPEATNMRGFLSADVFDTGSLEVYLYEADGAIHPSDINASVTHAGALYRPSYPTKNPGKVDLSPWLTRFAGKFMGVQLRSESIWGPLAGPRFDNVMLRLIPPEIYAAPTYVDFIGIHELNVLTNRDFLNLRFEISDADSFPTSWTVQADYQTIAAGAFPVQPSGSATVSAIFTNPHVAQTRFNLILETNGKQTSYNFSPFFIGADEPLAKSRPLSRTGMSRSFYVVDAAGRGQVWGLNDFGQLGLGVVATNNSFFVSCPTTLSPPGISEFRQIVAARNYAVALRSDGLLSNMTDRHPVTDTLDRPGASLCRKIVATQSGNLFMDLYGSVWTSATSPYPWVNPSATCEDFEAASTNRILFLRNGVLFTREAQIPFPPGVSRWMSFTIADSFALAIGDDGQMYGWGQNDAGQLPFASDPVVPNPTKAVSIAGVERWSRVLASERLSLALDSRGRLFAWGTSPYVGNRNPIPNVPTPVQFPKDDVVCIDMAVTLESVMALSDNGEVFAWGRGAPGMWQDTSAAEAFFPEPARGLSNILDAAHPPVIANLVVAGTTDQPFATIGARGFGIAVQASEEFASWTTITNLANTTGFNLLNVNAQSVGKQFLRVVPQ